MKKVLLFACAAALLFAACKKDNIGTSVVDSAIALSVVNSPVKSMIEGTTFPQAEDFQVFAYFDENADPGTAVGANFSKLYIEDKTFTFKSDGLWKGAAETYYWPKTGSLVFAGYHGNADVSFVPADGEQVMKIAEYEASYKEKSEDNMNDLMYFPVTDKSYNLKGTESSVAVSFYHALSWLSFQVEANETADGYFRVDSIKINGVMPKGRAVIKGTQASAPTCEWTVSNGLPKVIEVFKGAGSDVPSEADSQIAVYNEEGKPEPIGDDYIVIPQSVGFVTVSYSQLTKGVDGGKWIKMADKVIDLGELKAASGAYIYEWEPGKHYVYTISFNFDPTKDEILINPEVVDWVDVNAGKIEI